ncbi:ABC transporter permease [Acidovorax sp. SUPP2522]|uniref:ABC transporter permease n=1 Tax=unclassified Acidovorax TaxID=2684926 RepID=UPI00234BCC09|nr:MULTISPECIES: ABC transporter permease [unclassified Acidovorax]WCM97466.1 ABC transporter permease [Acidovorax sp. GBBC 1281]GKT16502.1 ABC transporter permease [Acidovorax sp. SUPP2522]
MRPPLALRPYTAAFVSRFLQMLQYRTAALAGFGTQCWWGGIKVMVLAAFYGGAGASGVPMPLQQAITYTWLAQGLLALLPWSGDPEVAQSVRTGAVAYDRLRPVDAYGLWFARSAGWIAARVLLSTALVMLLNVAATAALNERGINALAVPAVVVLSGNLLPLPLLPDAWQWALIAQPLAGLLDIPSRIHSGHWSGWQAVGGLALQAFWIAVLVALGRLAMRRTLRHLEIQGG